MSAETAPCPACKGTGTVTVPVGEVPSTMYHDPMTIWDDEECPLCDGVGTRQAALDNYDDSVVDQFDNPTLPLADLLEQAAGWEAYVPDPRHP